MGDIVSLDEARKPKGEERKPPLDAVWRCRCGCATHFARADGELECANCSNLASGASGEWRSRLPDAEMQVVPPIEEGTVVVTDLMNGEAACRRVLAADPKDLAAAIVLTKDGRVRAWGLDFGGQEQADWLDRRLSEARHLLTKETGNE